MILGGFYLGIALDTFRRFSPYWKEKRILTYLMEICFWLTQTFILFYVLFKVNFGELRVYVFAACLLGFAIYQVIASTLYKKLLEKFLQLILSIYQFCKKVINILIITPIKWMIQGIIVIAMFLLRITSSLLLFIAKMIYIPLKWILLGIYRLLPKKVRNIIHKIAGFYSIMENTCKRWAKRIISKRRK